MIDRMSGRVALLLVTGAIILVLLLGWFILVAPQQSKASKLNTQVNDTNVQLQAVTSLLEGPVGRQSLAALRVSKSAVPDTAKMSQILRQLSAAAGTAGVELDSISPQAAIPLTGAEALPMSMTVKGHYFAIRNFLRILRSEAVLRGGKVHAKGRLYTIDSIQFTGQGPVASSTGQSTSSNGLVQAALAVNAFVNAPALVAGAAAPTTTTTDAGTSTVPPATP